MGLDELYYASYRRRVGIDPGEQSNRINLTQKIGPMASALSIKIVEFKMFRCKICWSIRF